MAAWAYNQKDPNAPNAGLKITLVGSIFTAAALLFMTLRLYVRSYLVRSLGLDDWMVVATWLMSLGFTIVSALQTKWGMGLRIEDFPEENTLPFGKLQYAGAPFYILGILGFKLCLLISYIRIASDQNYKRVVMVLIVACTMFSLSFLFTQLFLCDPPSFQWDRVSQSGTCLDGPTVYYSMASLTIVFDVVVIVTPIPLLARSQLPNRKKVVLIALFAVGFFITICQLIRIVTIKNLKNYIDSSMLIMWSMVELNLGIIIACVPTISPLVCYCRDRESSAAKFGQNYSSGYNKSRERSRYVRKGMTDTELMDTQLSRSEREQGFVLTQLGDATKTVINGGTHGTCGNISGNDSEEYIMKGDGGNSKEGLGGIRAETEVTVEISGKEIKAASAY
ncbi:hypothetical protein BDZ91DRAFT_677701 [Kalaharituber pfeilii]|nr:hypothetical protein BDZ91DRAFT_677701 [Kalaharituber pfeilii]